MRVERVEIIREHRVRASASLAPLAGVPFLAIGVACWLLEPRSDALVWLAFGLAWLGAFAALFAPVLLALAVRSHVTGPLTLRHEAGAVLLIDTDGRARWRRRGSELSVVWRPEPARVEVLDAKGDEAQLTFLSPEAAARAVIMLRAAARDRRAYRLALEDDTTRLWRCCVAWFIPCAAAMVIAASGPDGWPVLPLAVATAFLGSHGSRRLILGADGVRVVGRFGRRYLPYRDLAGVETRAAPLGRKVLVVRARRGAPTSLGALAPDRARLVEALLREGVSMVAKGEAAGTGAAALALPTDDLDRWRRTIECASRFTSYRGAALEAERLSGIVRNPATEASRRIAAAFALRVAPGGAALLRKAAAVCADPSVREALSALAGNRIDEERARAALARALEAPAAG